MTLRKLLPRQTLRERDNTDGRYPTLARTGDTRTGKFNTAFDDSDTHFYVSGTTVTVSYPTSLRTNSSLLTHDMTSSMTGPGRVDKGTVEVWQRATKQVGSYAPFREVGLHEQDGDRASAYYLTGSDPGDIGFGLKGRLDAKTAFHFELPIQHETHLDPLTASVYYYNTNGFLEEINQNGKCFHHPRYGGPYTAAEFETNANYLDVKFFDALGNYAISGSKYARNYCALSDGKPTTPGSNGTDRYFYHASLQNGAVQNLSIAEAESVLVNPLYAASVSQSLDVSSFTSGPFIVERIEIEMPFKAGPGWLRDCTSVGFPQVNEGTFDTVAAIGGPGITVALSNQLAPNRRELIASATLFPEKDSHPWAEITSYIKEYSTDSYTSENVPTTPFRFAQSAKAMGVKPTVLVGNEGDTQFTGSLRFTMEPRISNGLVISDTKNVQVFSSQGGDPTAYLKRVQYSTRVGSSEQGTVVFTVNPFGRAGFGDVSGRSIFGRERAIPKLDGIPSMAYIDSYYVPYASDGVSGSSVASLKNDIIIFNKQANAYSPYVITPGDRLVLSISKYRPAWMNRSSSFGQVLLPTASHDVSIPPGAIRMSIYGSQLREGREFHDTLNTPLTSDAVHETINYVAVTDQFLGAARKLRSGSYLDRIVTGSFALHSGSVMRGVIGSRSVLSSTLHTDARLSMREREAYEFGGTNLTFAQASSPNERYWDTLLPGIFDIWNNDNAVLYGIQNSVSGTTPDYAYTMIDGYTLFSGEIKPNNHFGRDFPFGPRYSTLTRRLEQSKPRIHKIYDSAVPGFVTKTPDQLNANYFILDFQTSHGPIVDRIVTEMTGVLGSVNDYKLVRAPLMSDTIKSLFGFGDRNTMIANGIDTSNVGTKLGTTNSVSFSKTYSIVIRGEEDQVRDFGSYRPVIRGWKYGVMNGLPQYSKVIYRSDRFGQFRDMLEQRVFGTFYETIGYKSDGTLGGKVGKVAGPVTVKFVATDGTSVDPSRTASSNLSNEATSSLPFFDGELRNRLPVDESLLGGELVAPLVI